MATKKAKVAEKEKTASKKSKATKKVTDEQLKRLTELGYVGNGEEDAVKKFLVSFLEKNELEGTDEQDIDSLLDIAELFEVEETEEVEEEEEEEEETEDDGDEEVEEEEEEEEETEDDGDEEVEEEEESFAKEEKKEKVKVEKKGKKAGKTSHRGDYVGFDPNNKDHVKMLKPLLSLFSDEKKYFINHRTSGISVYFLGENSKFTLFAYRRIKVDLKKGEMVGSFKVTTLKEVEEFLNLIPKKYREDNIAKFPGKNNIDYNGATLQTVLDILENTKFLKISIEKIQSTDKRLGSNRKKLDESLVKSKTKKTKTSKEKEFKEPVKIVAKEVKKVLKSKKKVKK